MGDETFYSSKWDLYEKEGLEDEGAAVDYGKKGRGTSVRLSDSSRSHYLGKHLMTKGVSGLRKRVSSLGSLGRKRRKVKGKEKKGRITQIRVKLSHESLVLRNIMEKPGNQAGANPLQELMTDMVGTS